MSTVLEDDDTEFVDYSTTRYFPHEVLTRIFGFLPLRDRKSVRLVCRLWYYCCTRLSITKNEKFVFRTGFSVEEIAKVMLKSNFLQLNLEFQGLPISSLPSYTWKVCGHRIRSLEFFNCQWSDKTIRNIIIYCENMTSFTVETSFCTAKHNLGSILCSPRLLNELIKKGVKRTKLHTFTMFIDDIHLPESVLHKIFHVYPNIKHFGTGTISYEDSFSYCLVLHVGKQPVFSRLDRCLNTSVTHLESLTFNLPTHGHWLKTCIMKADKGFRLKHFETMLIYDAFMNETLRNFFETQKDLNVVRLGLAESNDEAIKKITFYILENCPNLREFRFKFDPYNLNLEWDELPKFFALISKLQFLTLSFNVNLSYSHEAFKSLLSPKNLALTTLRLENFEIDDNLCSAFLEHCPLLQHLELSSSDDILQTVFEYLPKLETLVLNDIDDCTDFAFTGRDHDDAAREGYSIKRLQQLKYLEIRGFGSELTEKFVLELQLPRLEFLALNIGLYRELSKEVLVHLASYLPELNVLAIDQVDEDEIIQKTIQFCKHLKRLQRLICIESDLDEVHDFHPERLEGIFQACPSLRYISDAECSVFLLNPFTDRVLRKNLSSFKFQGNVFEGDFMGLT